MYRAYWYNNDRDNWVNSRGYKALLEHAYRLIMDGYTSEVFIYHRKSNEDKWEEILYISK